MKANWWRQLKALRRTMILAYVPPLCLILLIKCYVSVQKAQENLSEGYFTRDPAALTHKSPLMGFVSNISVLLWCATAAICLFTARVLRRDDADRETARFLKSFGLLTVMLLLDDLFLFHEHVFPTYLGVHEAVTLAAYLVAVSACLLRFRRTILATDYLLLLFSLGFFGLSLASDAHLLPVGGYLLEDGAKLLGIVSWLVYFTRTSLQRIGPPGAALRSGLRASQ